nr:hypothetical protein [Tanacetum cinerariifolium]
MAAAAELDEIKEVNENCILMANLQQASTSGTQSNCASIYDTDGSAKNGNDVISEDTSVEQGGETVEQHPENFEEIRALYESLYQNLAIKVEKVNSVNRKLKETNADLTTKLEAAKFVGDFKSLANEADASLAKHKALELEIKRLLKAVVSQDIMIIVQNQSVVDTSDLQTELERTKEHFKNCIIKKETEYAKLWNDWYKKCDECKYDKISYDKAYKDMQQKIERLQAQLGDLKGKSKDTSGVSDTQNPLSQKLENENVELEFQVPDQKDNTQDKSENTKFAKQPIVENLSKIGETNALSKPVTSNSVSTPQESKGVNNDKVIASGMFRINPSKTSREEKHVPNTVSASTRTKPITISQQPVITKKNVNSDLNGLSSTGVDNTNTRRPQPRSNTKHDRVPSASKSSRSKNKEAEVEEHHKNLLLSKNNKHISLACNNIKIDSQDVISKVVCVMCSKCLISVNHDKCLRNYVNDKNSRGKKQTTKVSVKKIQKKYQPKVTNPKKVEHHKSLAIPKPRKSRLLLRWSPTGKLFHKEGKIVASRESKSQFDCSNGNLKLLINFVWKFMGTVRFENDHVAAILGFGDRSTNLYTINLHEMASASPICLMARASSTKSWLWHQRLSYLNFDTINDLAKNVLVAGLPKFKYHKEHFVLPAIATACFTQNRSIIHRRFNKTPYELINDRKLDISILHVFGALCYPKNDREDIGMLGTKGDIGFFIGLQSMTSGQISSGLDLTYALSTITTQQPSEGELDLLFEAMYNDYIGGKPSATRRSIPPAQEPQVRQTLTASTTIADIAPTPTNPSSLATNIPITSQDVDELNQNAMVDGNTFVNPFAISSTSVAASSSSQNVDPSNMHKNQLRSDGDMCMYALSVSTMEPKNVKEAMTNHAWIDSMQEKILQFKMLDVWVLVPAPDNISPLTLKWLFKKKHDEEQTVIKKKSRLVMRGYHQEEGIDFEESFALALYGLKQAPKAWYDELSMFLLQNHFFKGTIDPTLFIRRFHDDILVAKPIEKHLKEVKRIFHYLRGTINTGLWYTKDSSFELTGFSDADYAGCKDTFKSTSGGAQFSAIAISCNPVQHSRTKHIAVRYHFIKEYVEKGTIELYIVKTDYQLADIFTKALPADRFNYLVRRLGMCSLSPKELERLAKSYQSQRDLPRNTTSRLSRSPRTFRVILFSIHSDEWKSFQSQHQTALRYSIHTVKWSLQNRRIRRWRYNLTPAESKFKIPMLDHQDKNMMKAQVHVSKSSAISVVQTLPRKKRYRQNVKAYVKGEIVCKLSRF